MCDSRQPTEGADSSTSWKPEFFLEGKWSGNALRFATEREASIWAERLLLRWVTPTDARAVPSQDPVRWELLEDGRVNWLGDR